jgi:cytidylate kinase
MNMLNTATIPVIAIDGPSASGKGTVAQLVASELGFHYLDSGALYRLVALATQQQNIAWHDAIAVTACAKTLNIRFVDEEVFLNNIEVSALIRSEAMGKGASEVAVHAPLRTALLDLQHGFRQPPGLVGDGRDMGTVIFTDAVLKVFLTASTEVRATRRYQQLLTKNHPADYADILRDLQQRDARDQGRASAPLVMAADAILLETDNLSISAAVDIVLKNYRQKMNE